MMKVRHDDEGHSLLQQDGSRRLARAIRSGVGPPVRGDSVLIPFMANPRSEVESPRPPPKSEPKSDDMEDEEEEEQQPVAQVQQDPFASIRNMRYMSALYPLVVYCVALLLTGKSGRCKTRWRKL